MVPYCQKSINGPHDFGKFWLSKREDNLVSIRKLLAFQISFMLWIWLVIYIGGRTNTMQTSFHRIKTSVCNTSESGKALQVLLDWKIRYKIRSTVKNCSNCHYKCYILLQCFWKVKFGRDYRHWKRRGFVVKNSWKQCALIISVA